MRVFLNKESFKNTFVGGLPSCDTQNDSHPIVAFCLFSMGIGGIVSAYGTIPLCAQNVGASIEALSWNTPSAFSTNIHVAGINLCRGVLRAW
jgi:hypothetical protein